MEICGGEDKVLTRSVEQQGGAAVFSGFVQVDAAARSEKVTRLGAAALRCAGASREREMKDEKEKRGN